MTTVYFAYLRPCTKVFEVDRHCPVQYISNLFWTRWIREYFHLLQERQRWCKEKRSLDPGDIVLVADATAPHSSLLLG